MARNTADAQVINEQPESDYEYYDEEDEEYEDDFSQSRESRHSSKFKKKPALVKTAK